MLPRKLKRSGGRSGKQADADRLLDVDVLAEGAADEELLDVGELDAHRAAEQRDAGVHGRFGAHQAADVALADGDVAAVVGLVAPGDDVLGPAEPVAHARRGEPLADVPALVDDPGHEELGDEVDQAAAADAARPGVVDGAVRRFEGVRVDPHVLDRADRGAHAAGDAAAFEGGAGRAGAGDEPLLVAEDHLAVGADVDEDGELVGRVKAGRR